MFGLNWLKKKSTEKVENAYGSVRALATKGVENYRAMNQPITEQQRRYNVARLWLYGGTILSWGLVYVVAKFTTYWLFLGWVFVSLLVFYVGLDKALASDLAKWFYTSLRKGGGWELDPVRDRGLIEEEAERRILELGRYYREWEALMPGQRRKRAPEALVTFQALTAMGRFMRNAGGGSAAEEQAASTGAAPVTGEDAPAGAEGGADDRQS